LKFSSLQLSVFPLYPVFLICAISNGVQAEHPETGGEPVQDGLWRSFPKVPHLLQYVSNGNYYGRIKVAGKTIRESLKTKVWSTAKLRLTDFLKNQQSRDRVEPPKFSAAVELFKQQLASDTSLKPQSRKYHLWCRERSGRPLLLRLDFNRQATVVRREAKDLELIRPVSSLVFVNGRLF
jgi:hypothetical protein